MLGIGRMSACTLFLRQLTSGVGSCACSCTHRPGAAGRRRAEEAAAVADVHRDELPQDRVRAAVEPALLLRLKPKLWGGQL